jgi:hypothetical protein
MTTAMRLESHATRRLRRGGKRVREQDRAGVGFCAMGKHWVAVRAFFDERGRHYQNCAGCRARHRANQKRQHAKTRGELEFVVEPPTPAGSRCTVCHEDKGFGVDPRTGRGIEWCSCGVRVTPRYVVRGAVIAATL